MEPNSGTYTGTSTDAALNKAAEELGVSVDELEHETLLGSDGEGHVLIRARVRAAGSVVVETVERILELMGYQAEVKGTSTGDTLRIEIVGEQAVELAQADLQVERSLAHLIRRMGEKIDPGRKLELQILAQEEDRDAILGRWAELAVDRCRRFGRKVMLPPMNPYERRLVHLAIREHSDLETESMGSGRDRRVVVLPPRN